MISAWIPPDYARLAPLPLGGDTAIPRTKLSNNRGRDAILVDEWGPYDWHSLKLWPVDSARGTPVRLMVLGSAARWGVAASHGVSRVSARLGRTGDTIVVTPKPDSLGDWGLTLEVRNRGRFSYEHFEPAIDWNARFFVWTDSTDPRTKPDAFQALLGGSATLTRHEPRLDYEWYRPTISGLPLEHWALEAQGTVTLGPGDFTIRTISDDAVRVWVDGKLAIDDWTPHESVVDHAPLTEGPHTLKVQYFQLDGWTELRLDIVRGIETSTGSPGPH